MTKLTKAILTTIGFLILANLSLSYFASHAGQEIFTKEITISQLINANLELKNQIVHQSTLEEVQLRAKKLGLDTRLQLTTLPTPASLALSH